METPPLQSLYQQLILEHYSHPRNKGELAEKTVEVHLANPVCGDEIRLQLRVEGDTVADARFTGQGCSISQAAVSMMTQLLKGRKLSDAETVGRRFTEMMHGSQDAAKDKALGDLRALQGVSKFPVRIKCALLGFDALQEALRRSGALGGTVGDGSTGGAAPRAADGADPRGGGAGGGAPGTGGGAPGPAGSSG